MIKKTLSQSHDSHVTSSAVPLPDPGGMLAVCFCLLSLYSECRRRPESCVLLSLCCAACGRRTLSTGWQLPLRSVSPLGERCTGSKMGLAS